MFLFNFFNFYFPFAIVGFYNQNFYGLFELMLVQMAFKQIAYNVQEFLTP